VEVDLEILHKHHPHHQEDLVAEELVNPIHFLECLEEQEIHLLSVQFKDSMVDVVLVEQQLQTVVQEQEVAAVEVLQEYLLQIVVYQEEQVVLDSIFLLLLLDQQHLVMVKQAQQAEFLQAEAAEELAVVHQSDLLQVV
jgi:hypothetical protein